MTSPRIRPLPLCIFHLDGKILLSEVHDPIKKRPFFRLVGRGIKFGEASAQAIIREVQEELGMAMTDVRLLGTLENTFKYAGRPGHEIVQVYDAKFVEASVYKLWHLDGQETDGATFTAKWHAWEGFTDDAPLGPDWLYERLKKVVR